jgi:hypothetical protein
MVGVPRDQAITLNGFKSVAGSDLVHSIEQSGLGRTSGQNDHEQGDEERLH